MFLLWEKGSLVLYDKPEKTWTCRQVPEVQPAMEEAQAWVDQGYILLGFLTYEASPAFDPSLKVVPPPTGTILAHWEAHRTGMPYTLSPENQSQVWLSPLTPRWDFSRYGKAFQGIREALVRGDTYQINLTMGFDLHLVGRPELDSLADLWMRAVHFQPGPWQGLCGHPDGWILSLSPELFFHRDSLEQGSSARVTCLPMKGTRPRDPDPEQDRQLGQELLSSPKDRAENLMITDMIRNDLGKAALPGSVRVPRLFALETYSTVHQMVSEVTARTWETVPGLLKNIFPCASITGAPKVRTMDLITGLEQEPRGIYTGSLGRWDKKQAWFNVAIRTLELDREGRGQYRAGGGVVWDSDLEDEWKEVEIKTRILSPVIFPADLVETLKWTPEEGFFLGEAHLQRLKQSARDLGFPQPPEDLLVLKQYQLEKDQTRSLRVRLVWTRQGEALWTWEPLMDLELPLGLLLSSHRQDTSGPFFRHKTTQREFYSSQLAMAKRENPRAGEVLLRNLQDRVTEGSYTNLAYRWQGRLCTPPLSDGLLPGILRQSLLNKGLLEERSLETGEAPQVEAWLVLNSVRGLLEAHLLT